jgi:hypothetical protein
MRIIDKWHHVLFVPQDDIRHIVSCNRYIKHSPELVYMVCDNFERALWMRGEKFESR